VERLYAWEYNYLIYGMWSGGEPSGLAGCLVRSGAEPGSPAGSLVRWRAAWLSFLPGRFEFFGGEPSSLSSLAFLCGRGFGSRLFSEGPGPLTESLALWRGVWLFGAETGCLAGSLIL
jgi:hypothetical protein